jgi:phthalate 4,5-cis-dihydrodiol dehydrogenase
VEPAADMRDAAAAETGAAAYADLPAMLHGAQLDAVYIATPTELHPEHVAQACAAGKHVLTEKPMAIRVDQAQVMVAAADLHKVVLQVGHSHSYDLPIARMREIVASGALGRVRMIHTWNFTDWMTRPRRPAEFDVEQGGGVTYRQGAHQIDILRLIGGGMVKSVRAQTFDWDERRRSIGAHTIFLHFADGTTATAIYNGYGHFSGAELIGGVGEWGEPMRPRAPTQTSAPLSPDQELAAKRKRARSAIPASAPHQPHFGLTLVSCERGDIRQSPDGLLVYSENGCEEIALPNDQSPRDRVIAEFADAIAGKPVTHTGRWGLANLEACTAAIESSRTGKEIELKHQVSVA